VRFSRTLHLDEFLSPETKAQAAADAAITARLSSGPARAGAPSGAPLCSADLFAVVVHQGDTVHSGHYYAYVRGEVGGKPGGTAAAPWYKMNDSVVTPVAFEVRPLRPLLRVVCVCVCVIVSWVGGRGLPYPKISMPEPLFKRLTSLSVTCCLISALLWLPSLPPAPRRTAR